MANKKYQRTGMCMPLVFITIFLTCIGVVMVFSATYNKPLMSNENAKYFSGVTSQGIVAIAGLLVMLFLGTRDYHILKNGLLLLLVWGCCIVLLVIPLFSESRNAAHRWIWIGEDGSFQPSEIAKFMAIVCAAYFMSQQKEWYKNRYSWLCIFIFVGALAGLIIVEPDLSTTMCLLGAVVVIMFVSGLPWKFVFIGIGCIAALLPIMIFFTKYQGDRMQAWLHAWEDPKDVGYQVVQSLYAIGDGGLFGVGIGNSKQKITHLPMSDTDYIFSIICEEFGLIGGVVVIMLYIAYAYFGIKIAMEASDRFGTYLATGVTALVILQAFINMGVATNVLPSTGLTLPFISKGATSLGIMMSATGILLSVSNIKRVEEDDSNG